MTQNSSDITIGVYDIKGIALSQIRLPFIPSIGTRIKFITTTHLSLGNDEVYEGKVTDIEIDLISRNIVSVYLTVDGKYL